MIMKSLKVLTLLAALQTAFPAEAGVNHFFTLRGGQAVENDPDFTKSISDISNSIDELGLAPVKINVIIIPEDSNASFDSGNNIQISRSMCFPNHMGTVTSCKYAHDVLNVYAHEYGHAVFDKYISAAIPEFADVKRIYNQMSALEIKPYTTQMTKEQIAANSAQYKALYESLKNNKEHLRIIGLTMAYHEVFADTIAVFLANSKNAISEALYNPQVPWYNQGARIMWEGRDFGQKHDLDTWEQNEVHLLFSPLRSQIGLDECWPKDKADQIKKLKHLGAILSEQMKKMYADRKTPDIPDNRELIEKYKEICK